MITDYWSGPEKSFLGKKILILGGRCFLDSSLSIRLHKMGAEILPTDAILDGSGGNHFNIDPDKDTVQVRNRDFRDESAMAQLVNGKFNVSHGAAQACHPMSLTNSFPDIGINILGTAVVTMDAPEGTLLGGVPAKPIRPLGG